MTQELTTKRKSKFNQDIIDYIAQNIDRHPHDIAAVISNQFKISRMTANRYLQRMVVDGSIKTTGETKARKYELVDLVFTDFTFPLVEKTAEDVIWRERVQPHLTGIKKNVLDICQYGVTEMVNNVIDHSNAQECTIRIKRSINTVDIVVHDNGVGIFEKIKNACHLDDVHHALLELSKGKLTTDPSRHSGEGIFFTSRMFERFLIISSGLCYGWRMVKDGRSEWLLDLEDRDANIKGTVIYMRIGVNATHTDMQIFKQYEDDNNRFSKTHVAVGLAQYGHEQLVSRSQARRLLARFERFTEIALDFNNVQQIGQAFADEVFRVFVNEHPAVKIYPINTTEQIENMIKHVKPT